MVHCRFTLLSLALVTLATCAESLKRIKRQQVGSVCNENIDCLTTTGGGYCDSTKRCACLTTSISVGGFCWPKINPGQTGCQYQAQCDSMWPGSTCDSTNVCRCPGNQPPAQTNDGIVCRRAANGCPTNSLNSKLKNAAGVDQVCILPLNSCDLEHDCFCPSLLTREACIPDRLSVTYCCPSRALACIMPKEEGIFSGGTVQNKFWFNSATGNCEPLSFTGTGGNANNFDSVSQCESYCKTACLRGRPQYIDQTEVTPPVTCSSTTITTTNPCDNDNYCYIRDTSLTSYCCPRQTKICVGDLNAVRGEATPFIQPRTRYYYDNTTQTCVPFPYNGQRGNYNNFATEAECTAFCASSTCDAGNILRDSNQVPVVCSSNSDCPTRYTCARSRCCPTQEFICNLPMLAGTCSSPSRKWYFNADTRTCTEFTYNGCQGNFNNFDSYNACQTYCSSSAAAPRCPQGIASRESDGTYTICSASTTATASFSVCPVGYYCNFDGVRYGCCPTKTQTCEVEGSNIPSSFSCITPVSRWYYNAASRQCVQFNYNGCDGTSNNFATQLDCQDYCGVGGCKDSGGEPYKDAGGQNRVCTANGNECPPDYRCSQVTTITSTTNMFCCPTKESVCKLSRSEGTSCGISSSTRYYFNPVTKLCESFTYKGCQGNRNNFATITQCQRYCNSAACAPGQIAYSDPVSNALTTCQATTTSTAATGCLPGYQCVNSNLLNQGVCCGSNAPTGTCPQGQSAFMDAFTGLPMQCLQNTDGQCPLTPNRFSCQPSFTTGSNFCCAAVVVQCSRGGNVGQDALGNPLTCTPNIQQNCPSGYECQPVLFQTTTFISATGYCCGTPNPCGQGFNTLFVNNQPVTCDISVTTSTCSDNRYSCTRTASGQGFCCVSSSAGVNPCASGGKSPYLIQGAPTVCIPGSGNTGAGCPVDYTCDLYAAVMTSYCCRTGTPIGQNSCPSGSPSTTTCTVNANCGSGFVCKPGSTSSICCPSPASVCGQAQTAGQICTTASQGQRYSYNPSTRSCTAFTYLGCGGNSNNFFSAQACEEFCMPALCARGKAQYVTGGAAQTCTTAAQCNSGYQCSVPQFGGGVSVCCELPTTVCSLPMDAGRSCSAVTIRPMQLWYFSSATRTCVQFNFNGCGGNANSFETQSECQTFCGAQPPPTTNPCPSPRTAQTNPTTNQPVLCISAACATGFVCTYSSTSANYYCCSRTTVTGINGCPSGSPSLFPGTNSPLACTVGGPRCPTNYACVKSTSYSGYQCCSSTSLVSIPTSSSTTPTIRCTASDYCKTRLKSTKAFCNLKTFLCSCDTTEIFANNSCGSGSTAALTQAATMPIIRCTSNDYCRSRLKSSKAICTSSLTCSCDPSERYANDACAPGTIG